MLRNILSTLDSFLIKAGIKLLLLILYVYYSKIMFIEYGFPNLTLTSLQLLSTWLFVLTLNKSGLFLRKKVNLRDLVESTVLMGAHCVFTNLSLDFNAVEVSQMFKFVQLPIGLILMSVFFKKTYSLKLKLTTVIIIIAIIINSIYDYTFDIFGLIYGLLACLFGSLYHLWLNKKQIEEDVSSLQLLLYQTPAASIAIFLFSPIVENNFELNGLFDSTRPLDEWCIVFLSCFLAALYNVVAYYPVETGNKILTHLINNLINFVSLIVIIILGAFKFDEPIEWQQIVSVLVVPLGILLYSKYRGDEESNEKNVLI